MFQKGEHRKGLLGGEGESADRYLNGTLASLRKEETQREKKRWCADSKGASRKLKKVGEITIVFAGFCWEGKGSRHYTKGGQRRTTRKVRFRRGKRRRASGRAQRSTENFWRYATRVREEGCLTEGSSKERVPGEMEGAKEKNQAGKRKNRKRRGLAGKTRPNNLQ